MITQMLTDTLIRGWQITHEVNISGVLFFSPQPPPPQKKKKTKTKTPDCRLGRNRPFLGGQHLTTTSRIHFVFDFLFQFLNPNEV